MKQALIQFLNQIFFYKQFSFMFSFIRFILIRRINPTPNQFKMDDEKMIYISENDD